MGATPFADRLSNPSDLPRSDRLVLPGLFGVGGCQVIEPHPCVNTRVEVKFVTTGRWKPDGTPDSKDGYSIGQLGSGQALRTLPFEDLPSLVVSLVLDGSNGEDE